MQRPCGRPQPPKHSLLHRNPFKRQRHQRQLSRRVLLTQREEILVSLKRNHHRHLDASSSKTRAHAPDKDALLCTSKLPSCASCSKATGLAGSAPDASSRTVCPVKRARAAIGRSTVSVPMGHVASSHTRPPTESRLDPQVESRLGPQVESRFRPHPRDRHHLWTLLLS